MKKVKNELFEDILQIYTLKDHSVGYSILFLIRY